VVKREAEGKLDNLYRYVGGSRSVVRDSIVKACVGILRFGPNAGPGVAMGPDKDALQNRLKESRSGESPQPTTPPATPTPYTRGLAALNEGNFDTAVAEFTTAIADDPKNPFSYIRRGAAYEKKGDAASAISDYRNVLKLVDADSGAEYAAKIRKLEKTKK
jgi:tetratricopeptide (TPR) repeat protein